VRVDRFSKDLFVIRRLTADPTCHGVVLCRVLSRTGNRRIDRNSVGAALLCNDGTIIQGCNVENASYGQCSQRNLPFLSFQSGALWNIVADRQCCASFIVIIIVIVVGAGICAERTALVSAVVSFSVSSPFTLHQSEKLPSPAD
jgi:cytidine deaminase